MLIHRIGLVSSFKTILPTTAANIGPPAITNTALATVVWTKATILQIIAPLSINPANIAIDPDSFNIRCTPVPYRRAKNTKTNTASDDDR